jgi:hypothetical protein
VHVSKSNVLWLFGRTAVCAVGGSHAEPKQVRVGMLERHVVKKRGVVY